MVKKDVVYTEIVIIPVLFIFINQVGAQNTTSTPYVPATHIPKKHGKISSLHLCYKDQYTNGPNMEVHVKGTSNEEMVQNFLRAHVGLNYSKNVEEICFIVFKHLKDGTQNYNNAACSFNQTSPKEFIMVIKVDHRKFKHFQLILVFYHNADSMGADEFVRKTVDEKDITICNTTMQTASELTKKIHTAGPKSKATTTPILNLTTAAGACSSFNIFSYVALLCICWAHIT